VDGEKVGHVKRQVAASISAIMDQFGDEITIDATIPYAAANRFKMPLQIDFYARDPEQVKSVLVSRGLQLEELTPDGAPLYTNEELASPTSSPAAPPRVKTTKLDWKGQQKTLDEMFEEQSKLQLTELADVDFESLPLRSDLFEHQKIGVRWLKQKELGLTQVPFYKTISENGKNMYLSQITNSSQVNPPEPCRGGMLCDGMC
jgi:hypothetical protein